jgi:hypothetical protein
MAAIRQRFQTRHCCWDWDVIDHVLLLWGMFFWPKKVLPGLKCPWRPFIKVWLQLEMIIYHPHDNYWLMTALGPFFFQASCFLIPYFFYIFPSGSCFAPGAPSAAVWVARLPTNRHYQAFAVAFSPYLHALMETFLYSTGCFANTNL